MKRFLLAAALFGLTAPSLATEHPSADPTRQALVHMLSEAQSREANALVQVYTLKAQIADLSRKLEVEIKRADEAEAKPPKAESAK